MMVYLAWICETCNKSNKNAQDIWNCPSCDKEICENCFDRYAHCYECSKEKSDKELILAASNEGWDF